MFENMMNLFESKVQLHKDGTVTEAKTNGELGMWTMAAFRAERDQDVHADVWERHPHAEELLTVTSGAVRVHLRESGESARLEPGSCYVVPRGTWHRLTVEEPADLLTVTPRAATEHERMA